MLVINYLMKNIIVVLLAFFLGNSLLSQELRSESELKLLIPNSIKNIPLTSEKDGMMIKLDGVAFSNASGNYSNSKIEIEIVLMDFFGASDLFKNSSTAIDNEYKTDNSFIRQVELDGKKGYVLGDKKSNSTVLILAWNERYVLNIRVKGKMDEAFVKSIYKEIDLGSL